MVALWPVFEDTNSDDLMDKKEKIKIQVAWIQPSACCESLYSVLWSLSVSYQFIIFN